MRANGSLGGRGELIAGCKRKAAFMIESVENQAQKDLLRTDLAKSTGDLEIEVEQVQAETASQLAEFGEEHDAINRLQVDLGVLRQQLCTSEEELALKTAAMHETERAWSDKDSKLAKLIAELDERSALGDAQKVEIIALKTQVDAKAAAMQETERTLSEKESAKLMTELDERSAL